MSQSPCDAPRAAELSTVHCSFCRLSPRHFRRVPRAARQTEICRPDRSIERIYFAARRAACRAIFAAAARRAQLNVPLRVVDGHKIQMK